MKKAKNCLKQWGCVSFEIYFLKNLCTRNENICIKDSVHSERSNPFILILEPRDAFKV